MPEATTGRPGRPATLILGRYPAGACTRTLYARRKGAWTYISDEPATNSTGEVYLVEEIPDADGEAAVEALAADYLSQARKARAIPMAYTIIDVPGLVDAA